MDKTLGKSSNAGISDGGSGGGSSNSDTELLRSVIIFNAESLWSSAACLPPSVTAGVGATVTVPALFGFKWAGPCSQELYGPSATTQTAALDVLTAAVRQACSGGGGGGGGEGTRLPQ